MTDQTIKCPQCQYEIPLTEALSNQIRQQLQAEVDQRGREQEARFKTEREALEAREKELTQQKDALEERVKAQVQKETARLSAEARRKVEEEFTVKLEAANSELKDKAARIKEFQQQELALAQEREKLQEQREGLELEKQRQRETIRTELEAEFRKKQETALTQAREDAGRQAREQVEQELKQTQGELEEKNKKVRELQERELGLRKEKQQLEESKATLELDVQRRLDEERAAIVENTKRAAAEEQRLKDRENQDRISKLSEQLADAQRRIEQGSQERQGEMLEEELVEVLRRAFAFDQFEDVKRGARGADVLQTVRNPMGKLCGRILWESKNTKVFDKNWLVKLKKDQQESGAELAVLMTMAMPAGVEQFFSMEDVWVTDCKSAMGLCAALRQTLMLVERERLVTQHADCLKDIIYQYVTGQEFTTRVKMIYLAYQGMQADLENEKRAMQRIWRSREKRISLVLDNLTGMRGELEGIVGGQMVLPSFEPLSLEVAEEEEGAVGEG